MFAEGTIHLTTLRVCFVASHRAEFRTGEGARFLDAFVRAISRVHAAAGLLVFALFVSALRADARAAGQSDSSTRAIAVPPCMG